MGVRRIYVEKKSDFAIRAKELLSELRNYCGLKDLLDVRVLVRYDIENISDNDYKRSINTIFVNRRLITVMRAAFHIKTETFSLL